MIIIHIPEKRRFETIQEELISYVEYLPFDNGIDIVHTVVPSPLEGRGIAAALLKEILEYAVSEGLSVITSCGYASVYMTRHPAYAHLLKDK